ncbi:MAG TPA: hypothetical protein VE987_07865 [Polyangiaceae bacterium]|nr:hypothetical protein [Polyangiaceae bacterium]
MGAHVTWDQIIQLARQLEHVPPAARPAADARRLIDMVLQFQAQLRAPLYSTIRSRSQARTG